MLLHRSPVLRRDLGCSDGLKTQNQTPEVHHHIISSEKCWCKLLSSAFKIRVHLKPAGFAAWVSRFIGCLFSERKITAESWWMVDGLCSKSKQGGKWGVDSVWLITTTYCKELKKKKKRNNLRVAVSCRNWGYLTCGCTEISIAALFISFVLWNALLLGLGSYLFISSSRQLQCSD